MDRRHFLAISPALALVSTRLFAVPKTGTRFLLVFLRGGYDAASLLVPTSSPFYYEARPTIAIPRPGTDANAAQPLTADWALHPALKDSILPLYQSAQAAFVPFAGTDGLTRSHFETQDSIELGQASGAQRNFSSGFMNRLALELNGAAPMAFTDQLPLVLRGELNVPNMALRNLARPSIDPRLSGLIAGMYAGTRLERSVGDGFETRDEVMREMAGEMEAANRNAITAKGFELEARRVAKLMKEKYSIGFVDVGGWDTHVGQGAATGYLASRLGELGQGLAAFADEIGTGWRNTVVVVISEFGRTFWENGNRGTDHGHGSVYWVLGGAICGGRVLGEQKKIEAGTLFQGRDYPVLNDYRALLGGLFGRLYGLGTGSLQRVFSGAKAVDLGLL